MSATADRVADPSLGEQWQRNLVAIFISQFGASFGLQFSLPFLPIFLSQELGVADPRALALWTGISTSLLGVGLGLAAPIWGALADRTGRKPMLVRAMLGGAITLAFMGASGSPLLYALGWLLFGLLSGTTPAAAALVASGTPRRSVAFALGMTISAQSLGQSVGPAIGGVIASAVGMRAAYYVGAGVEACATLPILFLVREAIISGPRREQIPGGSPLRLGLPRSALVAIAVLLAGMALYQTSWLGMQRLVVLRMLEISPTTVTLVTGIAFTLAGLGTAGVAAVFSRFARLVGYRGLTVLAMCLMTGVLVGAALTSSTLLLVGVVAVSGLSTGIVRPAIQAMLAMEAPEGRLATVFGLVQFASAAALVVGPLVGGGIAAAFDSSTALLVMAAFASAAVFLLLARGREPSAVATEDLDAKAEELAAAEP